MGLFGLFNKQKKESLDKGLEKTKQGLFQRLGRLLTAKRKVNPSETITLNLAPAGGWCAIFK